jgi:predicted dinucleotide-binding enzyme
MKVGVLGSGAVGETLANGFLKKGHDVMRLARSGQALGLESKGRQPSQRRHLCGHSGSRRIGGARREGQRRRRRRARL